MKVLMIKRSRHKTRRRSSRALCAFLVVALSAFPALISFAETDAAGVAADPAASSADSTSADPSSADPGASTADPGDPSVDPTDPADLTDPSADPDSVSGAAAALRAEVEDLLSNMGDRDLSELYGPEPEAPDYAEGFNGDVVLPDDDAEYNGFIVKLKDEDVISASSDDTLVAEAGNTEVELTGQIDGELVTVEDLSAVAELDDLGLVEYAEPDYIVSAMDDATVYADDGWGYTLMNVACANNAGLTGQGVKIGVIDSGVRLTNPNLSQAYAEGRILPGRDFTASDANTPGTTDNNGHGTNVAQVLVGNNDPTTTATSGVANKATIIPLRILDENGKSNIATSAKAIRAAVDDFDCDILNMSIGTGKNSATLSSAVEYAASKGVIMVGASGNIGTNITKTSINYPAAYPEVIGVGNAGYSPQTGITISVTSIETNVFVSAPGSKIPVLDLSGHDATASGTSFSCPAVAGIVALLKQSLPDDMFTDETVRTVLADRAYRGELLKDAAYSDTVKTTAAHGYGFASVGMLYTMPYFMFVDGNGDQSSLTVTDDSTYLLDLTKSGEGSTAPAQAADLRMVGWTVAGADMYTGSYDANGKLIGFMGPVSGASPIQTVDTTIPVTPDTGSLRLFCLNQDLAPIPYTTIVGVKQ